MVARTPMSAFSLTLRSSFQPTRSLVHAGFPARGEGGPFGGRSRRTDFSHDSDPAVSLCDGSPYHPYTGRAAVSKKERPGGLPLATAYAQPFRQRLIGERYSGKQIRRRRETFTGQHRQPLCPGDPAKHPERPEQVTVYLDSEKERTTSSPCFSRNGSLAPARGRNATPPGLYSPGPSVAVGRPSTLAAYPTKPTDEFEQVVLYRYGPAQVGFDQTATSRFGLIAPFETEPTMPAVHTVPTVPRGNAYALLTIG
jgi:hypothetical protein